MTQRPTSSDEQFSTATSGSGFDTVDLGTSSAAGTPAASYGSSYNQPQTSTTQDVVDQAKDKAGQLADQAQQKTGQVVDQARNVVTTRLSSQKDRTAEGLGSVAQALRQTSQQLREQDQAGVTDYVDSAANQIERFSGYLQGKDVGEVVDDVEQFARRQPALFLGGAFVLGLLGARFLKSSSRSSAGSRDYPLATRNTYTRTQVYGQGGTTYGGGYTGGTGYQSGYQSGTTTGYQSGYQTGTTTTGYQGGSTSTGIGQGYDSGATTTGFGSTGSTSSDFGTTDSTRTVGGMEER